MTLDRAETSDGSEMTLAARDDHFVIRVDGQDLMHSNSHGSEEKLARYGCAGLADKPGARVLIGGMGMGFTARAALNVLAADATVDVVELVSAVVRWNRDVLGHLAGSPLADARTTVIDGDVAEVIAGEDAGFTARLRAAGFTVDVKRVLANGSSTRRHVLWLARLTRR